MYNIQFTNARDDKIRKIREEREKLQQRLVAISVSPSREVSTPTQSDEQETKRMSLWDKLNKAETDQLKTERSRDLSERFRNSYAEAKRYNYDKEVQKMRNSAVILKTERKTGSTLSVQDKEALRIKKAEKEIQERAKILNLMNQAD